MTTATTTATTTRERPILFSGPMVRAILEGRKTQTRRVIKLPERADPDYCSAEWEQTKRCEWMEGPHHTAFIDMMHPTGPFMVCRCPYGQIGDRLWVRESAQIRSVGPAKGEFSIRYRADDEDVSGGLRDFTRPDAGPRPFSMTQWTPSIHMPRWASRITLEIIGVRVERLREITAEDIRAEGFSIPPSDCFSDVNTGSKLRAQFEKTWDKLNSKRGYSWESNPWVWVVEFRRIKP